MAKKTMTLSKASIIVTLFSSILFLPQNSAHPRELEPGAKTYGPSKNPPRVEIPRHQVDEKIMPKILPRSTPGTEWTFHKTPDNAHPDANEQQMLWLMNRARANPTQEGIWLATTDIPNIASARSYFTVDVVMLQSEFAGYDSKPPAAFDVRLYNAAKVHSDDLIARDAQDHNNQFQRVEDAGFSYLQARGNVFSYTQDSVHGHAGFNIDWGYGTGGMQNGRGHRMAIMSVDGDYTNVGIAIVSESDYATDVGPFVTTENFCKANTSQPDHYNCFIVGTVWNDLNNDEMYDPGEGVGNVTVTPNSGMYYAVTSNSGGYAIPISSPGAYTLTFSGAVDGVKSVTVGAESVLLDGAFTAPTATSPTVTTTAASSVTSTSASSGGNVISDGGASITARGVCWSTSANPTTSNGTTTDDTGVGAFTSAITGLSPGTTYHVRAYATNSANLTGYGDNISFDTSNILYVSSDEDCGTKDPCYGSIQEAINVALTGFVILVKQGIYAESLSLGSAKTLVIKGGYDETYTQQAANTTFVQALGPTTIRVSEGSLNFQMINVNSE